MYPIVISPPKIAGIGHEEQAIAKFLPINFLKSLFWEEQFDLRARDVSKCAVQIANDIGIAESTVKVHRTHLMRKMKARSLPELSRMADTLNVRLQQPQNS